MNCLPVVTVYFIVTVFSSKNVKYFFVLSKFVRITKGSLFWTLSLFPHPPLEASDYPVACVFPREVLGLFTASVYFCRFLLSLLSAQRLRPRPSEWPRTQALNLSLLQFPPLWRGVWIISCLIPRAFVMTSWGNTCAGTSDYVRGSLGFTFFSRLEWWNCKAPVSVRRELCQPYDASRLHTWSVTGMGPGDVGDTVGEMPVVAEVADSMGGMEWRWAAASKPGWGHGLGSLGRSAGPQGSFAGGWAPGPCLSLDDCFCGSVFRANGWSFIWAKCSIAFQKILPTLEEFNTEKRWMDTL